MARVSSSPQPGDTGDRNRRYPAEKARQGVIILRRPWQRAGLFGAVISAQVLGV
jgi:hypothetical protein